MNLFLALVEEHKQRTGHDPLETDSLLYLRCNVCLYLGAEKRDLDKAEADYYKEQEKLNHESNL